MNPPARPVLASLFLLAACTTTRDEHAPAAPPPETAAVLAAVLAPNPVGSLERAQAFGQIFLGGQPNADDLALFATQGVRTVVNLRTKEEPAGYDEPARATELGLAYESLPFAKPEQLDDAVFAKGRALLSDAPRPLLLHCASGNRVGALWIPWRVLDGGIELEAAVVEAKAIGLKSAEYEAKARDYVARHAAP